MNSLGGYHTHSTISDTESGSLSETPQWGLSWNRAAPSSAAVVPGRLHELWRGAFSWGLWMGDIVLLKCFAVSVGGLKQPQKIVLWVLTVGDFRCNCNFVYKVVVASGLWKSGMNWGNNKRSLGLRGMPHLGWDPPREGTLPGQSSLKILSKHSLWFSWVWIFPKITILTELAITTSDLYQHLLNLANFHQ